MGGGLQKRDYLTIQLTSLDVCNLVCALGLLSYRNDVVLAMTFYGGGLSVGYAGPTMQ